MLLIDAYVFSMFFLCILSILTPSSVYVARCFIECFSVDFPAALFCLQFQSLKHLYVNSTYFIEKDEQKNCARSDVFDALAKECGQFIAKRITPDGNMRMVKNEQ